MSVQSDYEEAERKKLTTVLTAAQQNRGYYTEVEITTTGHDPHASVRMHAGLLLKWLSGEER